MKKSNQQTYQQNNSSNITDNSSYNTNLSRSSKSSNEKPVILSISSASGKPIKSPSTKAHHYRKDHTTNLVAKTSQIVLKQNQETIVAEHSLIGTDQLIGDNGSPQRSHASKRKIKNTNPDPTQITTTAVLISDGQYRKLSSSDGEYVTIDSISENIEQIPKNQQYKYEYTDSISFHSPTNKNENSNASSVKSKRREISIQAESDSNFEAPLSPYNPYGLRSVESQSTASRQMKRQQNNKNDQYSLTDESEYEYMYINEEEEEEEEEANEEEDQYEYQYDANENQDEVAENKETTNEIIEEESESEIVIKNDNQQELKSFDDVPPLNVVQGINNKSISEIENPESDATSIPEEESANYSTSFENSKTKQTVEIRSNSDLKFSESSQNQHKSSIISDQEISNQPRVDINDEEIEEDQNEVISNENQNIKNSEETPISKKALIITETEAMEYINPHSDESSTLSQNQQENISNDQIQTEKNIDDKIETANLPNKQNQAENDQIKSENLINKPRESIQIQTENMPVDQIQPENKQKKSEIKPNPKLSPNTNTNDNDDVNDVFKSLSYSTIENNTNSGEESTISVFQEYVFGDENQKQGSPQDKKVSIESSFEFNSEKPIKRNANQIAHSINKLANRANITQDSTVIIDDVIENENKQKSNKKFENQSEQKPNEKFENQSEQKPNEKIENQLEQASNEKFDDQSKQKPNEKVENQSEQKPSEKVENQLEQASNEKVENPLNQTKENDNEEEYNFEKEFQQVQRSPSQEQRKTPKQLCLSPTNLIEAHNSEPSSSYIDNQPERRSPTAKREIKQNSPQNEVKNLTSPKSKQNGSARINRKHQTSSDEITTATYETEMTSNKKSSSVKPHEYYSDEYYTAPTTTEQPSRNVQKKPNSQKQHKDYDEDYSYSSDSYTYMTIETKSRPINQHRKPQTDYDYYSDDMTDFTLDYVSSNYKDKRRPKQISYHKQELPLDLQKAIQEQLQLQLKNSHSNRAKPSLFKIRVKDSHLDFLKLDKNNEKEFVVNTIDRHGKMTPHKVRLVVDPNQLAKSKEKSVEIIKSGPHKGMIRRRIKKSEKKQHHLEKLRKKQAEQQKLEEETQNNFIDAGIDMSPSFINRNGVPTTKTRNVGLVSASTTPSVASSTSSARKRFYDENGNPVLVEMSDSQGRHVFRRIIQTPERQTPERFPIPRTPPQTQKIVHHVKKDRFFTPNSKNTNEIVIDDSFSCEYDSNKKNVGFDMDKNNKNNDPELEFGKPFRSRSAPHKRKPKYQNPHIYLRTNGKKKEYSSSDENLDEENPFLEDVKNMSNEEKQKKQEEMIREINRLENILLSENTNDKTKYSSKGKPQIELLQQLSEDDEEEDDDLNQNANLNPIDPSGSSSLSQRRKLPKMTVQIPNMGNTGQADIFKRHYELITQKQQTKKDIESSDSSCNASTKNTESKKEDGDLDSSKRRVKRRIRVSLHDGSRSPAPHPSHSSKQNEEKSPNKNVEPFSTPKKDSPHLSRNLNSPISKKDPNVEIVIRDGKRKIKRKVSITPSNTSNRSHSPPLHSKSSKPVKYSQKAEPIRESPIEQRGNVNPNNASLGDFLNEISTSLSSED